ncbi:MAG: carboxylating nicotinate-nucleotide diphosphorylase, partial [Kiritimatiellaceae bacterium]|nr:carboxylating nicotinate-nucleotide diphosphorylase [Kiritimatiellaceae bacterium]
GATVAAEVFRQIDPELKIREGLMDGSEMKHGDVVLTITGSARSILVGERTALNFIQRMSGVATLTRKYVEEANNPDVKLLDTRKTTPTLRVFEKYSVLCGGGTNHRMGLYDMAMLKDNHLAYWAENHDSGICGAVQAVRDRFPDRKVEVEVDTIEQLREVLPAKPDWVLLDNMPLLTLRECVKLCEGITQTEASGGVTLDTLREIAKTGVNAISVGALTHSAPSADLALDWA